MLEVGGIFGKRGSLVFETVVAGLTPHNEDSYSSKEA